MSELSEEQVEAIVVERGLTAPRVTPGRIDSVIASKTFTRVGEKITFCELTLLNGFRLGGVNMGPVDIENLNEALGQDLSYKDARSKIWELEGYLLAEKLFIANSPAAIGTIPTVSLDLKGTWDQYPAHQQRVLQEEHDLNDRVAKLISFFNNPIFIGLDEDEQKRLRIQAYLMLQYRNVLRDRINAFPKPAIIGTEGV